MNFKASAARDLRLNLLAAAVAGCFAGGALGNPTGGMPQGTSAVTFANLPGNVLQVTNSPNSIIHWQSFSIGANETTRFVQQSAASAVLNRVVAPNPSEIFGTLQSNGRVFLINPSGILFGPGATVDVAGLVASSLNLSNEDFLNNRLRFTEVPGAGSVTNQGLMHTPAGGHVLLVGPAVSNGGIINTPQGDVVLAAGNRVELENFGTPGLAVSVTAPGTADVNLGSITADSGRVGIFAGLINQGGTINANQAVIGVDGSIRLMASGATTLAAGSLTQSTGPLSIDTGDLTVSGNVQSGPQTVNATGHVQVQSGPGGFAQLGAIGGQTIHARSLEVTARDGSSATISNSGAGNQTIVIAGGGASQGIDVRSLDSGGLAAISNNTPGATQTLTVTDADHINVNGSGDPGARISAVGGTQSISITGNGANAINIGSAGARSRSQIDGSSQFITAGQGTQSGSVTIIGSDGDVRFAGITSQPAGTSGTQAVGTTGTLSIFGSDVALQTSSTGPGVFHNTIGPQSVSAGRIVLQAGSHGVNNRAAIGANNGSQLVNVGAGGLEMTGGSDGNLNSASINSPAGPQTITVDGDLTITAGLGGTDNFASIGSPAQLVTVHGDLALLARGSVGTATVGGGARIGGTTVSGTNLVLDVGRDVTITAGSVSGNTNALLGNTLSNPMPTNISVNAGRNVTLNGGTAPNAFGTIGSRLAAPGGGEVVVNAGGTIAMNSSRPDAYGRIGTADGVTLRAREITQGPDARIQASSLHTETTQGANLVGANAVAEFSASNSGAGTIALNNASPLLTVSTVSQVMNGPLAISQAGDLRVSGLVASGSQAIDVTGGLVVQPGPFGYAQLSATGGQTINARSLEVIAQDGGSALISNNALGDQAINVAGGGASTGLDVRSQSGSGVASILSTAPGATQSINVTDADHVSVGGLGTGGASITANPGNQAISIMGSGANAINIGSAGAQGFSLIVATNQSIVAGAPGQAGSISIVGSGANAKATSIVSPQGSGGSQAVSTSGLLNIAGGTAPAQSSGAGLFHNGAGPQTVSAAGIVVHGGSVGSGNGAFINSVGPQQVNAGAGGIALVGGAGGANNTAGIFQNGVDPALTQAIALSDGGSLSLRAGGGSSNNAVIGANGGLQQINADAGAITMVGGAAGTANGSLIRSPGMQSIASGDIAMLAGEGGTDNFAGISAPRQQIAAQGDLTLTARGSTSGPTIGGGARIGGLGGTAPSGTNLSLDVAGNVTISAGNVPGANAGFGNNIGNAMPTNINVNAGGNVTLNGGTVPNTFATIGSRLAAPGGGEVVVNAGGTIAMNSSGPDAYGRIGTANGVTLRAREITQGLEARIQANTLSVETRQATSLVGANAVNSFNAVNSASGAVAFNNTSPLLTVTGIDQVPAGTLTINQAGNLFINGDVSSGAQAIAATGDITVTPGQGSNVSLHAYGPQSFSAGGNFSVLGGGAWDGFAQTSATGPVQVATGGDLLVQGGTGFFAYGLLYGTQDVRLTVGNELHLNGGAWPLAFARIQTGFWNKIYLDLPNQTSGGYFVDGREGVSSRGLDGLFTGLLPARPGRSLILNYGN